jgi:hypothetical protein
MNSFFLQLLSAPMMKEPSTKPGKIELYGEPYFSNCSLSQTKGSFRIDLHLRRGIQEKGFVFLTITELIGNHTTRANLNLQVQDSTDVILILPFLLRYKFSSNFIQKTATWFLDLLS